MSRSQRRHGSKSLRRIKIQKGESRHHRKCVSLGGTNHESNISIVKATDHQHFHALFSNLTPPTICAILNEKWLDRDYEFICVRRKICTK